MPVHIVCISLTGILESPVRRLGTAFIEGVFGHNGALTQLRMFVVESFARKVCSMGFVYPGCNISKRR
jgi:hypothetical protein